MPEPVPSPADLVRMGPQYAEATDWARKTKKSGLEPMGIRVLPAGHALMGEVMHRNAQEAIARGAGDWYPDPPHRRERTEQ